MDHFRFDTWTRRRFGVATGGVLAAALGLSALDATEAKRKKRKKRCRKLHQLCRLDGTKPRCCKPMTCIDELIQPIPGFAACCRTWQTECTSESQCCQSFKCQKAVGLRRNRCCAPLRIACSEDSDCCAGDGVICDPTLICCRDLQAACAADDECCGELRCLSNSVLEGLRCCVWDGEDCQEDNDCCSGSCVNGTCTRDD